MRVTVIGRLRAAPPGIGSVPVVGIFERWETRAIRAAVAVVGMVIVAGCSGDGNPPTPAEDRAEVERVFKDYNEKLADRDFDAACEHNAPETIDKLLENLRSADMEASTCQEALAAIYATPDTADLLDQTIATTQVQSVTVSGDTATVTWSAEAKGQRVPVTSTMRRVEGDWKLVDVD